MTSRFKPWHMPLIPAKKYLWNDEFTNALAAASVHGSPMTPSPGTRTVVDAESKLSIADGKLFFNGGKAVPAYGDPGAWADTAITRKAGKIVAFKFMVNDATTAIELGLDTDKTGEIAGQRLRIASDTLKIYDGTTAGPTVFVPLDGVEYTMVFVTRTTGILVYLKSGTGYYKYLGETTINNTATLYAGIANYSAVAYCDFVRLPKRLWLPAPLLSDSFTGDAGTADGRTPDGAGHLETSGLGSGGTDYTWSGSGAVDGSGNLVITPTLGEELLTDGGFENWTSDTNLTSWTEYSEGLSTIHKESTIKRSGSYACRFDIDAVNSFFEVYRTISNSVGDWISAEIYCRGTSATDSCRIGFQNITLTTALVVSNADFTRIERTGKLVTQNSFVEFMSAGINTLSSIYGDDFSVKKLTISTCFQTVTLLTTDIEIIAAFTMLTGLQAGVVIGLNEAGTSFIIAYHDGNGKVKLEICEAGTYTTKSTVANTYVAGAEIRLRRTLNETTVLTELWLYYGGVLQGSGPTTTLSAGESTNLSGLKVGLFSTSESNNFSKCVIRPVGSNNEYSILNSLVGA